MLSGRIVNQSGLKLQNARILYGSWAYRLKDIEPNAARVFDEDTVPIGVKTLLTGLGWQTIRDTARVGPIQVFYGRGFRG